MDLYDQINLSPFMPVLADDEVIVNRNAEGVCHRDNLLRHLDVGMRGRRIARRMIVHDTL
jgi:hypothetical protein